jgi:TRAP-type C4-dicarboxylate transport system permease small subunit
MPKGAVLQVICRFFFDALVWSDEPTRFLLVLASLVGAAVGFKRGSHIAVTFFLHRLPPVAFRIMAVLLQLVAIAFFGIVAWYGGVLMVSESGRFYGPGDQASMDRRGERL